MLTRIELNETNKTNVLELVSIVYPELSFNDATLVCFLSVINADLTEREIRVLALRYGLDGSGMKTLAEVAREFGLSGEKVRQIEAKTIRILRHPVRGKYIFGIVDEPKECSLTLSSDLKETNLSVRTLNSLKRIGITSVSDLMNVKLADLLEARNLGKKSFKEIVDFIKENKGII